MSIAPDIIELASYEDGPEDQTELQIFENGAAIRSWMLVGLVSVWIAAVSSLVLTIILFANTSRDHTRASASNVYGSIATLPVGELGTSLPSSDVSAVFLPLALSVLIGLCNEYLGCLHLASLRRALSRGPHGQKTWPHFNSKLRLLSHSNSSLANSWPSNLLFGFSIAMCYTAASQTFFRVANYQETGYITAVNGWALGGLSIGMLVQASITSWSFLANRRGLPARMDRDLYYEPNDGMGPYVTLSVGQDPDQQTILLPEQPSVADGEQEAKVRYYHLWAMINCILAWAVAVQLIDSSIDPSTDIGAWLKNGAAGSHSISRNSIMSSWIERGLMFLLAVILQLYLTLGLHCTEALVNASQDEKARSLAVPDKKLGVRNRADAIKAALTSCETVLPFLFKIVLHWAFGSSFSLFILDSSFQGRPLSLATLFFWANALFVLIILITLLAGFGTFLVYQLPFWLQRPEVQPPVHDEFQTQQA